MLTLNAAPMCKAIMARLTSLAGLFSLAVISYASNPGVFQKISASAQAVPLSEISRTRVVASFYPLYEFAERVGGSHIDITSLTPPGAEPHDYEPTPGDLAKIYRAQLLIFNGDGVDPWADKIQADLNAHGVEVLKISDDVHSSGALPAQGMVSHDPHFWLDPIIAEQEVDSIADALIRIDGNQALYARNRDQFKEQLAKLHQEYQSGLSHCQLREIIVSHNAFGYLAKRYHLTVFYISGLSPDEEPSPRRMAEIVKLAKSKKIEYIFFETLVNPKLAQTLAAEIGAKTLVLNPIEGLTVQEISEHKTYIGIMRENLVNLRAALRCQ